MSTTEIVNEDGQKIEINVPSEYDDLEFMHYVLSRDDPNARIVVAAAQTFVGFIPEIGTAANLFVTAIGMQEDKIVAELQTAFEDYLRSTGEPIESVSTRYGDELVFLLQKYEDDGEPPEKRTDVIRVTPIGFGTDAESALVYQLVDEENRDEGLYDARLPVDIEHDGKSLRRVYGSYYSVSLLSQKIRVVRRGNTNSVYRSAERKARMLGTRAFTGVTSDVDFINNLREQHLRAQDTLDSIEDDRLRAVAKSSYTRNREGLARIKKIYQAYEQAAANVKAARFLSTFSQVLSFGASIQNYVEVRSQKAAAEKRNQELDANWSTLLDEVKTMRESVQRQAQQLDGIKGKLSEIDQKVSDVLMFGGALGNLVDRLTNTHNEVTNFSELSGPIEMGHPQSPPPKSFRLELEITTE